MPITDKAKKEYRDLLVSQLINKKLTTKMATNKETECKPKKEKVEISSQKPNKIEVIKAVFKSENNKMKKSKIKLRLMAENRGGKAEMKDECKIAANEKKIA